jgi:hypothetical protein
MKTVVTLKRFYFKEIEIEVSNSMLIGKTEEEIADYLVDEYPHYELYSHSTENELFEKASLQYLDIGGAETVGVEDTDRYDIYDEDGKQIYGGHL